MGETSVRDPQVAGPTTGLRPPLRVSKPSAGFRGGLTWLVGWGTKGGLALADQALFAGAHLGLNILLARWLIPAEYGAFALAYAVFLLVVAIHNAVLVEPMIIFGSGRHFKERKSYLGMVLRGHLYLTIPAGLLLFGATFLVGRGHSHSVEQTLWVLAIVLPLALLPWLTRRMFYIEMRPGRAAAGSAVYFCSLLGLVWWLQVSGDITPATAIGAMGLAALASGGLQLTWVRPQWIGVSRRLSLRSIASQHWNYGSWILASAVPSWLLLNIYYLVLPAWLGLKAAGALKALANLAMPAGHAITSLGLLALPILIRHREEGGLVKMRQTVRHVGRLFFAGAVLYLVVLWVFRVQIIHFLYGGRYLEYSGLPVFLAGLVPLGSACAVTFGTALRAYERPDRVFWSNFVGSLLTLSLGLWLAATRGPGGALAGWLASYVAFAATSWFFYRKLGSESASA